MKLFKMNKRGVKSTPGAQSCSEVTTRQSNGSLLMDEASLTPPQEPPHMEPVPPHMEPVPPHMAPVPPHMPPAPPHMPPAPPHFRNAKIHVDFDDEDLQILPMIFGNEGDAYANAEIICSDAPDEMRVQFIQLLSVIKTVLSHTDPNTLHTEGAEANNTHIDALRQKLREGCSRYPSPGLGSGVEKLYEKLYGDRAWEFLEVLWKAPKEPPIISRMIAYLSDLCQKGA